MTDTFMDQDEQFYSEEQIPNFSPIITLSYAFSKKEISNYNAVAIALNGRTTADLDWRDAIQQAKHHVQQGLRLFWQLDLGLFQHLHAPLSNHTQFLSLCLALEHFRDTIWKKFHDDTIGLCLYQGEGDFSLNFKWEDSYLQNLKNWIEERFLDIKVFQDNTHITIKDFYEITPDLLSSQPYGKQLLRLFCCDATVDYLKFLATRIPDGLPTYLMLDMTDCVDPFFQSQIIHYERFDRFQLAIRGANIPIRGLEWKGSVLHPFPTLADTSVGFCLPSFKLCQLSHYRGFQEALQQLLNKRIPIKLIPEASLITEWDGLDYLIYIPESLTSQGKRKLQGFCAAGGTVVTLGNKLGFAQEIHFSENPLFWNDTLKKG